MENKYELKPLSDEFNRAVAKRMFGKHADKMKYAPWNFLILNRAGNFQVVS